MPEPTSTPTTKPTTTEPTPQQRPLLRDLLGDELRRIRRDQGRTLADVARSARISMPYLSELERGRKEASSEVLASVCEALRVEQADVLTEIGRTMTLARHAAERRAASIALRRPAGPGDVYCLAA